MNKYEKLIFNKFNPLRALLWNFCRVILYGVPYCMECRTEPTLILNMYTRHLRTCRNAGQPAQWHLSSCGYTCI